VFRGQRFMASINWTGGSGSWGNAADWSSSPNLPGAGDAVVINAGSITVTVGSGVIADAYTLNTLVSTLSVSGGSLYTVDQAIFGGAFLESTGGVYMAGGFGATFNAAVDMLGGKMVALSGATFDINDGGIIAGAFSGTGELLFTGGATTYINAGFTSSITSIVIESLVGFNTNFTTSSNFSVVNGGNVDLFGHKLTVSGNSAIDGVIGNGTLQEAGTLTLGAPQGGETYLDNGLTLNVTGKVIQSGFVSQGTSDAGAKIFISKTGQYLINGNWNIDDSSSVGTIIDAGIFAKTGGGKESVLTASFSSSGTIKTQIGTLLLNGLVNNVSGMVTGNGTLAVAGGQTTLGAKLVLNEAGFDQQGGVLVVNKSLAYAHEWDMTNGVLNINSGTAVLSLSGTSSFDGGTITGYGGTISLTGLTQIANIVYGGPNTIIDSGVVDQTGLIKMGLSSNPNIDISAGATWSVEASSAIQGGYGQIDNAGLFIDPNGGGIAQISTDFASTGTVTVNNSTLQFSALTDLAGTVTGNGLLDLSGPAVLEAGLGVSVSSLEVDSALTLNGNLTYANYYYQNFNANLALQGNTLTLQGSASFDGGQLQGGTVAASGPVTIDVLTLDAGAVLSLSGTADQIGAASTQFVANGTVAIGAGATYTMDDDVVIAGNGLIANAGTITAAGNGVGAIDPVLNSTGTVAVNDQDLFLGSGGSLGGTLSGSGTVTLLGGTYTLQSGLTATVAALDVGGNATLQNSGNLNYAGYFIDNGATTLSTGTLSLAGPVLLYGANLTGPGTLSTSGSTTLTAVNIAGGATLAINGAAEQLAGNTTITGGTMIIGAAGTYTLDVNQSITGTGALDVAGTLAATSNGLGTLNIGIVDTGTILANLGTLNVASAITGNGKFTVGAAGTLAFTSTSSVTASNSVSLAAGHADLILQSGATFGAILTGFGAGDQIEFGAISASSLMSSWNASNTQLTVTDAGHDSVTITFSTAQNLSLLTFGTAADGNAAVFHH